MKISNVFKTCSEFDNREPTIRVIKPYDGIRLEYELTYETKFIVDNDEFLKILEDD